MGTLKTDGTYEVESVVKTSYSFDEVKNEIAVLEKNLAEYQVRLAKLREIAKQIPEPQVESKVEEVVE